MSYDPEKHHRRSIRLQGYDYSRAGAYFVTMCTQKRIPLFGNIRNAEMELNAPGQMIHTTWNEIRTHYPGIDTDTFMVMPNHIHGIIIIVGAPPCGCPTPRGCPTQTYENGRPRGGAPTENAPTQLSLPDVVQRFKTLTTKRYMGGVKQFDWRPFPGKLWQRNYYEHIIRNEQELCRIRKYILENPAKWYWDKMNPDMGTDAVHESDATYGLDTWMV